MYRAGFPSVHLNHPLASRTVGFHKSIFRSKMSASDRLNNTGVGKEGELPIVRWFNINVCVLELRQSK